MQFVVRILVSTLLAVVAVEFARADGPTTAAEKDKFFDTKVKPILQTHCLGCHGGEKKVKGDLRLTTRESILKGGENGPAVSLQEPDKSLLIEAIHYRDRKMPPKGKLP